MVVAVAAKTASNIKIRYSWTSYELRCKYHHVVPIRPSHSFPIINAYPIPIKTRFPVTKSIRSFIVRLVTFFAPGNLLPHRQILPA